VPNTKSAAKRLRQNEQRRIRNKGERSRLKTAIKRVRTASEPQEASEAFREASKLIDRAAGRGLIHQNQANRSKSRLASHVRKIGGSV
jgi:small subunit ribosomal protein S20